MVRPLIITMLGAEIGEPHQTAAEQYCKEGSEEKRYKSVDTHVYLLNGEPHLPNTPKGTCKKAEEYDDEQDHVTHCLSPGRIDQLLADIFHVVTHARDYSRLTRSSTYFLPRLLVAKSSNQYSAPGFVEYQGSRIVWRVIHTFPLRELLVSEDRFVITDRMWATAICLGSDGLDLWCFTRMAVLGSNDWLAHRKLEFGCGREG